MTDSKYILVLGASGLVGSSIATHFLKLGNYKVIAPVRSLAKLSQYFPEDIPRDNLITPEISYYEGDGPDKLAEYIKSTVGKVNHVIAISGGYCERVLLSALSHESFSQALDMKLWNQIKFAQVLIPLLHEDPTSSYTIVTGGLGEFCYHSSVSLTTLANAAIYGMVLGLQAEFQKTRILEYRIATIIRADNTDFNLNNPSLPSVPGSKLADHYHKYIVEGTKDTGVVRVVATDLQ